MSKTKEKRFCACARCGKEKYCVPEEGFIKVRTYIEELLACDECEWPMRKDLEQYYRQQNCLDDIFASDIYIETLERQQGFPEYNDAQSFRLCQTEVEDDAYV